MYFCVENAVSILKNTRASWGFAPWIPTRSFAPEPHAARDARVARIDFFHFAQGASQLMGHPAIPCHGHPQAKLRH